MKATGDEVLWINESFGLNDAGHIIMTSYVDLRKPEDRTPIKSLVRACERQYALEDCETIMVSTPSRFRSYGEGLILDPQEGFARGGGGNGMESDIHQRVQRTSGKRPE